MQNMKFPEKLWSLVNECTSGAIGWGMNGDRIFIDYDKFQNEFLVLGSGVFKTQNVVSFIRQLNLYGFRKCNRYNDVHEFKHPHFVRGRKDLLKLMRRKLGYTTGLIKADELREVGSPKRETPREKKISTFSQRKKVEKTKDDFPVELSNYPNQSLNALKDVNSLPYGWWGNGYYPLNSVYPIVGNLPANQHTTPGKSTEAAVNDIPKKNEFSYWQSMDMYNNVIFVPVPAQYGLYPGYFNGNSNVPFSMPSAANGIRKNGLQG